ncbi:MAG: THUMP-like domain-containing protein [Propionibacteriaceae bacterium]
MTGLEGPELTAALERAAALPDVGALAAGDLLRSEFGPDVAAAALTQVALRRTARDKFGPAADHLFFTRVGLEQATRPAVSAQRAQRFLTAGVTHVVDLGCGIGADALALLDAGLRVTAVELDPETAAVATANLRPYGDRATVVGGDAVDLAPSLLRDPTTAVFVDPARRTAAGRSWRPEDVSPPWSFVVDLVTSRRAVAVKAGPGLPYRYLPGGVDAEWVSHRGDVVEVRLWSRGLGGSGRRSATLLPAAVTLDVEDPEPVLPTAEPDAYVFEPDGAAVRAGALGTLGAPLGLARLAPQIAYLTGNEPVTSPWLTAFAVLDVLPYADKTLRRWVRDHRVGTLEIKKRGIDVDPAVLRRRLKPAGPHSATLIISPTPAGARVLVVARIGSG